jgi:hypothetical protein
VTPSFSLRLLPISNMPDPPQVYPNAEDSSGRYSDVTVGTSRKRKGRTVKKVVTIRTGDPTLLARPRPSSPVVQNSSGIAISGPGAPGDPFLHPLRSPSEPIFPSSDFDDSFGMGHEEDQMEEEGATGQGAGTAADGEDPRSNDGDVHIVNCGSDPPKRKRLRVSPS